LPGLIFDPIQKKSTQKWAKNTWISHTFADLSPLLTGHFFARDAGFFATARHGQTRAVAIIFPGLIFDPI
jgi:hypothetical protein